MLSRKLQSGQTGEMQWQSLLNLPQLKGFVPVTTQKSLDVLKK
jgi:hypothetical protein